MSDELPSKRLAEWLDSPAGTDPPEGVDPEVLAAVFALTPNRAPAPRVSIDDILAGVESGPFATSGAQEAPTTDNVVRFPGNDARGELRPGRMRSSPPGAERSERGISPGEGGREAGRGEGPPFPRDKDAPEPVVGTKAPRRVRRPSRIWWAMPALGFGLAAAAAVMLIFPLAGKMSRPDVTQQEAAAPAAPTATATMPAGGEPAKAEGTVPTDGLVTADAPAQSIPEMAPADKGGFAREELAKEAEKKAPMATERAAEDAAPMEEPPPPPAAPPPPARASTTTIPDLPAGPSAGGGLSAGSPSANQAPAASAAAPSTGGWFEQAESAGKANPARSLPATSSPPAPTPTADGSMFKDEEDDFEMPTTTKSSASSSRSRDLADAGDDEDTLDLEKGDAKRESRKDKAPATPKLSAKPAPAPVEAQATSAGARRGYGSALDYDPNWYTSVPEVVSAYNAALAYESAGQWDQAATAWKALMGNARADVAQDAAYRAGKALRAAGRANEALAAVDQGLRRSSGNTAIRSRLSGLRADLLTDLGEIKASKSATEDAEEMDRER